MPASPPLPLDLDGRGVRVARSPSSAPVERRGHFLGSSLLLLVILATAGALFLWKRSARAAEDAAAAQQPEPVETVTVATAALREHRRTSTSIGTILALQSVTLRNEIAGTVREVRLVPGEIVEAGTLLVALDVSVEEAERAAQEAQAKLAETLLGRVQRALENRGASELDVDRAKAEHDVALANVERTRAVIERKTIRAPFRARVGIADVHPGQYLNEGTELTTLQGIDEAVHVDFTVSQDVAAGLREGEEVEVVVTEDGQPLTATIVALDARIDPRTRNALVRARLDGAEHAPAPGASVRVRVPIGPPQEAVTVPVSALRRGPAGDHVFVIEPDPAGQPRAHVRAVQSGAVLGDEILVEAGLAPGEQVAASGSFKLREGVAVAIAAEPEAETETEVAGG